MKPGVPGTCEVRAYPLNKERESINIIGITAVLVVEGKDGKDVLVPLQVTTTQTAEKNASTRRGRRGRWKEPNTP